MVDETYNCGYIWGKFEDGIIFGVEFEDLVYI